MSAMYAREPWVSMKFNCDPGVLARMHWTETGSKMWFFMQRVYESLGRVSPSSMEGAPKERVRSRRKR